jgi:hypothetical protein
MRTLAEMQLISQPVTTPIAESITESFSKPKPIAVAEFVLRRG